MCICRMFLDQNIMTAFALTLKIHRMYMSYNRGVKLIIKVREHVSVHVLVYAQQHVEVCLGKL